MSLTGIRSSRARIAIVGLLGFLLAIVLVIRSGSEPHLISISGTFAASSLDEMLAQTEAIAIVEATGQVSVRWNSQDGRHWGKPGVDSFIYRDVTVRVVQALFGDPGATLILRDVGGTADGFTMEFEGAGSWVDGVQYLVLLQHVDSPVQGGSERVWTAVGLGQGQFSRAGGRWVDAIQGIRLSDDDLAAAVVRLARSK